MTQPDEPFRLDPDPDFDPGPPPPLPFGEVGQREWEEWQIGKLAREVVYEATRLLREADD